jgi:hypothetical protein
MMASLWPPSSDLVLGRKEAFKPACTGKGGRIYCFSLDWVTEYTSHILDRGPGTNSIAPPI